MILYLRVKNGLNISVGCEFEVYKKTRRRVIFAYLILSLAALSWGINNTFFYLNRELTLPGSIINGICGVGLVLWISLPPPAFGTEGCLVSKAFGDAFQFHSFFGVNHVHDGSVGRDFE